MRKQTNVITMIVLAMLLVFGCLAGCGGSNDAAATGGEGLALSQGGVLCLKVNPEIAISYDDQGIVTGVTARNNDAIAVLQNYAGFENKQCRQVVSELVTVIGNAGYFVEDINGSSRQITIEIETGSGIPTETFLDEVVTEVQTVVTNNQWNSTLALENEANGTVVNYDNAAYGQTPAPTPAPAPAPAPAQSVVVDPATGAATTPAQTVIVDTDYGPGNDGVTDYNDTDYGPNNDGVTDYNDTDYGPNNDGVTDYNDTDYGPNNDGVTDYNDTDYGPNADGVTDYNDTDYGPNADGVTDYSSGNSNYSSGNSNYSSDSGYDD